MYNQAAANTFSSSVVIAFGVFIFVCFVTLIFCVWGPCARFRIIQRHDEEYSLENLPPPSHRQTLRRTTRLPTHYPQPAIPSSYSSTNLSINENESVRHSGTSFSQVSQPSIISTIPPAYHLIITPPSPSLHRGSSIHLSSGDINPVIPPTPAPSIRFSIEQEEDDEHSETGTFGV
jgi:hypothetical protein